MIFALLTTMALSAQPAKATQQNITVDAFSYYAFSVALNKEDTIFGFFSIMLNTNDTIIRYDNSTPLAVTFYIMSSADFTNFQVNHTGGFNTLVSIVNLTHGTFFAKIPKNDSWYIVLDNLLGTIQEQVSLDYTTTQPPPDPLAQTLSWNRMMWTVAIVVIVLGIGIGLAVKRNEWRGENDL
jgi:hypothetical protein